MQKYLIFALAMLIGAGAFGTDAHAKRFGGGKSFGKQREQITQPAPRPAVPPPVAAPSGGRSWLGPLAGLAAGGLLASLFMGHGFDGIKFFDILLLAMLAVGVYLLWRKIHQTSSPAPMQYAGTNVPAMTPPPATAGVAPTTTQASSRPAWFEDEPFLRAAKGHFIRLQEAYDRADLNDIREYTTPEVFAEIQLQLQERGSAKNKTDVLQLNAAMMEVVTADELVVASVRFTGSLREEEGAPAQPLDEVWHIQKSANDRNAAWFVAGIQQAA